MQIGSDGENEADGKPLEEEEEEEEDEETSEEEEEEEEPLSKEEEKEKEAKDNTQVCLNPLFVNNTEVNIYYRKWLMKIQ